MQQIQIPYIPRPAWKNYIHPSLETYRFACIACHRRFGKTIGMLNQQIKEAWRNDKEMPRYAYVAPFLNQAKDIAWEPLKKYTMNIPGLQVNNKELYVEFPSRHRGLPGARLYVIGADKPQKLRGVYWDCVVLDEFAQMRPELWSEVVLPSLADRQGNAYIIGTPRGQNQFFDIYERAKRDKNWYSFAMNVYESKVIPADEIELIRSNMTELMFAQEFMVDFNSAAFNALFSPDLIQAATSRTLTEEDVAGAQMVLGVDVARYGDDRTTISPRKGLLAYKPEIYTKLNTMEVADRVFVANQIYKPVMIFIDVGAMGAGVIDRCRQLGMNNIIEVGFGKQALDYNRYANLRAEMYFKMHEWAEAGGALYDDAQLREELGGIEYFVNKNSRLQLESKEELKSKLGRSPDLGDGLALTFARPVDGFMDDEHYSVVQRQLRARNEYDPFRDLWIS